MPETIRFATQTSNMLVSMLDAHDSLERGHSRATAALADMLTRRMGLSDGARREIHIGALLHDVGKLLLPVAVLRRDDEEARELRKEHPRLGVELLRPIALWAGLLPIVLAHHEDWDGNGHPAGLRGQEIPLGARVVAVADSFDAMTRPLAFGVLRSAEDALVELDRRAGSQFDPGLVRLFVAEYRARQERLAAASSLATYLAAGPKNGMLRSVA